MMMVDDYNGDYNDDYNDHDDDRDDRDDDDDVDELERINTRLKILLSFI